MLGVGDFYYELGVQIIEVCLALKHRNGGKFGHFIVLKWSRSYCIAFYQLNRLILMVVFCALEIMHMFGKTSALL